MRGGLSAYKFVWDFSEISWFIFILAILLVVGVVCNLVNPGEGIP